MALPRAREFNLYPLDAILAAKPAKSGWFKERKRFNYEYVSNTGQKYTFIGSLYDLKLIGPDLLGIYVSMLLMLQETYHVVQDLCITRIFYKYFDGEIILPEHTGTHIEKLLMVIYYYPAKHEPGVPDSLEGECMSGLAKLLGCSELIDEHGKSQKIYSREFSLQEPQSHRLAELPRILAENAYMMPIFDKYVKYYADKLQKKTKDDLNISNVSTFLKKFVKMDKINLEAFIYAYRQKFGRAPTLGALCRSRRDADVKNCMPSYYQSAAIDAIVKGVMIGGECSLCWLTEKQIVSHCSIHHIKMDPILTDFDAPKPSAPEPSTSNAAQVNEKPVEQVSAVDDVFAENLAKRLECPVCLVNEKNVVFIPCGHLVCKACDKIPNCPICRAAIGFRHIVFL